MSQDLKTLELLDALKAEIKTKAGALFKTVEDYGGQFDEDEIASKSFTAPAAFTTCLGWRKGPNRGQYLAGQHVWEARIAVFIATKHASRPERMREAMARAEIVSRLVQAWARPACTGKPEGVMAENLYTRKLDKQGLALWMVAWWQEAEFRAELQLTDLTSVEITTHAVTNVPADPPPVDAGPDTKHQLEME
jgi:phage gp37-like protein